MTYDALLVARRGLGADELRLIEPEFASAVRWALFAEHVAPDFVDIRRAAETDPPRSLMGADLTDFIGNRAKARELLRRLTPILFPPDEVSDG